MTTTFSSNSSQKAIAVVAPNENEEAQEKTISVFLAGSIEMGQARDWQNEMIGDEAECSLSSLDIAIYSPRRLKFAKLKGEDGFPEAFKEQLDWEHKHLEGSSIISMFFWGGWPHEKEIKRLAPVTMLELGEFCHSGRIIVGCEQTYPKRDNVEYVCKKHGITIVDTLEELAVEVRKKVLELQAIPNVLVWFIHWKTNSAEG